VGIGRRPSRLRRAKQRGAVTATTTSLARGVAAAELVVVSTPVAQIVDHVCQAAAACPAGTLITDAGSTKERIVTALDRALEGAAQPGVAFVGSHPMAGSEKAGVEYSRADLFEGSVAIVTPSRRTRRQDCEAVEQFWRSLGARVIRRSPRAHDRAVAAVSHLPHVVAAALAGTTPKRDLPLVARGWLDATRVAAGDVDLWRQILLDNRVYVLKSLDRFEKLLASFRRALEKDHHSKLIQQLAAGKRNRDSVGN
jgi:prephenate dehydrogenase